MTTTQEQSFYTPVEVRLAVEVMGWTRDIHPISNNLELYDDERHKMEEGEWVPREDLNQAFLLVEQMRRRGWTPFSLGRSSDEWMAVFSTPYGEEACAGHGKEPAEAICNAIITILDKPPGI